MKMSLSASMCSRGVCIRKASFPCSPSPMVLRYSGFFWIIVHCLLCRDVSAEDITISLKAVIPTVESAAFQMRESSTSGVKERSLETDSSTGGEDWNSNGHVLPSFGNNTSRNVTTQLGQTAYLHCVVHNLGDKTVSWIRRKDFHVLTVGLDTYTSDDRFQTIHIDHANDWALQVKFAQQLDEGVYECQVSSDPKISYFVNLTVLVAKAVIEDFPELYVKTGSNLNLTCVITHSPIPPVFVFWYHNGRMINYDSSRGEITVHKAGDDTALSRLHIKDVQPSDSGNYSCCPSNAEATSINVHVLNGEQPAAMQHDANPAHSGSHYWRHNNPLLIFIYLWVVLR